MPILTSKKLGTSSVDRGQAEQIEEASEERAEHQAAAGDYKEEGDASGEGEMSDPVHTTAAETHIEEDQAEQKPINQPPISRKLSTTKPHPVVAGGDK